MKIQSPFDDVPTSYDFQSELESSLGRLKPAVKYLLLATSNK
jgi:hypothetical protein